MRFNDRRNEPLSIDLTPFIDVVFMLLLFFAVSTTFHKKETTQMAVQLPEANAPVLTQAAATIEIYVDPQGMYSLNGQALGGRDPQKLKKALRVRWEQDKSAPLLLMGDKTAPHQAVVSALEAAGELGITQVQIVAQAHREPHNKG